MHGYEGTPQNMLVHTIVSTKTCDPRVSMSNDSHKCTLRPSKAASPRYSGRLSRGLVQLRS